MKWMINETQLCIILAFSLMFALAGNSIWWFPVGLVFWYSLAVIMQSLDAD